MTDRDTVRLVVFFLGIAAILFGTATAVLIGLIIWLTRGTGSVDAAAVAIVGVVSNLATAALSALGALLVSTRTTPDRTEIEDALKPLEPLAVEIAGEPVKTEEVGAGVTRRERRPVPA